MSSTPLPPPPLGMARRRVREQARETAALMGFSALTSGALALAWLLLTQLAR